ncbi:MAG: hypothetical protein LUD72_02480 [Bacteroidales bacterium]|nr:hypothetical protein [Bacteroidales bacterium]
MLSKRRMTFFVLLCAAVFMSVCAAGFVACSEGGGETSHVHYYVVDDSSWTWSDDHSECTGMEYCTNEDGACNVLYRAVFADVTSENMVPCTEASYTLYTAVYDGNVVATYKSDPTSWAPGHDLEPTWVWTVTDSSVSAKFTIVCHRCGLEEIYDGEADGIEITVNEDGNGYTATVHATGGIYSSTYPETQD